MIEFHSPKLQRGAFIEIGPKVFCLIESPPMEGVLTVPINITFSTPQDNCMCIWSFFRFLANSNVGKRVGKKIAFALIDTKAWY